MTTQRFRLIGSDREADRATFAQAVRQGLTSHPKRLPCQYFYDREGSRLFEAICEVPEYYLPQAERESLWDRADEIVRRCPKGAALIELGSGNAAKTRILIEALLRRQGRLTYLPIDVSRAALEESARGLLRDYPALDVTAVACEYHTAFESLNGQADGPKLILWLGSNIGNFHRVEAARFLRRVRTLMSPADLMLVGIDLRKDRAVLERAYDDPQGVTARFNLNLLARINRELGGRFDPESFRHRADYNEEIGRVEMYLVSTRAQRVRLEGLELEVPFAAGEAIHTEDSYKYSVPEIQELADAAGVRLEGQWFDTGHRFSLNLFARRKAGAG